MLAQFAADGAVIGFAGLQAFDGDELEVDVADGGAPIPWRRGNRLVTHHAARGDEQQGKQHEPSAPWGKGHGTPQPIQGAYPDPYPAAVPSPAILTAFRIVVQGAFLWLCSGSYRYLGMGRLSEKAPA